MPRRHRRIGVPAARDLFATIVGRHRPGEQEALRVATAVEAEPVDLEDVLGSFGDDSCAQGAPHVDDRGDDAARRVVGFDAPGEAAVDLQLVDLKAPYSPERRIAGSEVVDRQSDPLFLKFAQRPAP